MDQTPLQICFNTKGATIAETGEKTIWTRTTGEDHEKRQCTVQLTLFADGEPRLKSLLIFKGTLTGQRILEKETKQYDSRVVVRFQENAWCDEDVMIFWLRKKGEQGKPFGKRRSRFITCDSHRGFKQQRK